MATNSVVRARIDGQIKVEAEAVRAAQRGEYAWSGSADKLLAGLNADD